jgi:hypothetical protein
VLSIVIQYQYSSHVSLVDVLVFLEDIKYW